MKDFRPRLKRQIIPPVLGGKRPRAKKRKNQEGEQMFRKEKFLLQECIVHRPIALMRLAKSASRNRELVLCVTVAIAGASLSATNARATVITFDPAGSVFTSART